MASTPSHIIIALALVSFAASQSAEIHVGHEKRDSSLKFSCTSFNSHCSFKLLFKESIFDINGTSIATSLFSPGQHERTRVHTEKVFDTLIIHLRIHSLQRSDKGIYSCACECPESTVVRRYSLQVEYPPHLKNCIWVEDQRVQHKNLQSLSMLKCFSDEGYPEGSVLCYSHKDGLSRAHLSHYTSGKEFIHSIFWLPKELDIGCCAINRHNLKLADECRDFIYPLQSVTPTLQRSTRIESTSSASFRDIINSSDAPSLRVALELLMVIFFLHKVIQ